MTTTTVVDSQQVEIVGPNLRDQTTGDFHVHAANCRELDFPEYHGVRDQRSGALWVTTARSQQDIVEEIYSDFLPTDDNGDETEWTDFEGDVHIFPCVHLVRNTPGNPCPEVTPEVEAILVQQEARPAYVQPKCTEIRGTLVLDNGKEIEFTFGPNGSTEKGDLWDGLLAMGPFLSEIGQAYRKQVRS